MHIFEDGIFKAYDIRGIVGTDLQIDDAYYIGFSFGNFLRETTKAANDKDYTVAVGFDARKSGIKLCERLIAGLQDSGINVINIGLGATPMLYFAVQNLKTDAGIMITGSHNPIEYNGFKITLHDRPISGKEMLHIATQYSDRSKCKTPGVATEYNIENSYLEALLRGSFDGTHTTHRTLRIGIDALDGSGGAILKRIIQNLPQFDWHPANLECNGQFDNILPEPSKAQNVERFQKRIISENLDLFFAFDGDADRVFCILGNGRIVHGDELTLLLSRDILKENAGGKVIFDVKSSMILETEILKYGGIPMVYKTGHSLIKQKLQEENAVLAGEMSGHIYINDGRYYPFDDGIYAFLRLLLAELNYPIDKTVATWPQSYTSPEIKIPCTQKTGAMHKIRETLLRLSPNKTLEIDGIKAFFHNSTSSILIRPSNTEAILVARVESYDEENFKWLEKILTNIITDLDSK